MKKYYVVYNCIAPGKGIFAFGRTFVDSKLPYNTKDGILGIENAVIRMENSNGNKIDGIFIQNIIEMKE